MSPATARLVGRELGSLILGERRLLLVAFASAVLGPIAAMALPFAAKLVVDLVIGQGRTDLLLPIALGAGLSLVFQAAASYGLTRAGAVAGHRVVARLRQRLHGHALSLPVGYFDSISSGTLVSRCMADADQLRAVFGSAVLQLVSATLTAVLAFAVLTWLNWQLTFLVAAMLLLASVSLVGGFGRLHHAFRSMSELQAELTGRLTEAFGAIRVVKVAGAERREALALARQNHRLLRSSVAAYRDVARLGAAITFTGGGLSLGLVVLGGHLVASGGMTLGDLMLFVFLVGLLSTPLLQVAAVSGEMGRAVAALCRIREVLAMATERTVDRGRIPVTGVVGTVMFDRVSYRYGSGPLVLRDLSFVAPMGSTTALVGPNGAGKSTLMGLLLAFDTPSVGHVLIDGRSLSTLRVADYRRHVGVVLQCNGIVEGTVAENIRYARPGATMSEFRWALRLAHCDEFVERLPSGYDTQVGERGVRLSGGQRQRIAIARAFLTDPRILLLDEATAHLDCENERFLEEALVSLCRGRTTFVITHRLATIQQADQILVLQSGALVERGTHEELLARRGPYCHMSTWQSGGVDDIDLEVAIHAN